MKRICKHLLFILASLACVHLPLLLMYLVKSGPAAYVLFYFPPFTLIPLGSLVLGICAGTDVKRYWYVPLLAPIFFQLSLYGYIAPQPWLWTGAYLLLGICSMLICHFVRLFLRRRKGG